MILLELSKDLEVLKSDTLFGQYDIAHLSAYEKAIYCAEHNKNPYLLKKLNYNDELLAQLDLRSLISVHCGGHRIAENAQYIAVFVPSCEPEASYIFLIDRTTFQVVQSKFFENQEIKDISFLDNNQLLGVSGYKGRRELSPEQPVKVILMDDSLNVIKEKYYGYPATRVKQIVVTNDQKGFYVSGNTYRSGQSESYFLKDDFTNLAPVYRPIDEAPLGVNVFPNPTAGLVKVLIDPAVSLPLDLRLVSTAGQVMQELKVMEHSLELNLSALPIGVYHLVLESGEESRTEKIIKMW